MAKLKAAQRNKLPSSDFAGPDRSFPVNDLSHARNALARVSQHGTAELKAKVRAAVRRKFPGIAQHEGPEHKARGGQAVHGHRTKHRLDRARKHH